MPFFATMPMTMIMPMKEATLKVVRVMRRASKPPNVESSAEARMAVGAEKVRNSDATTFAGASFFTLKRVMGDEALKLVAARASTPEQLALWYSKWAVQMTGLGIDFGLVLRNSKDENFHYKWALSISPDRVKWEVLNRVHRVLKANAVLLTVKAVRLGLPMQGSECRF